MDPLLVILIILVVLWIAGFGLHIGGGLIHVLLVAAVVVLLVKMIQSKS